MLPTKDYFPFSIINEQPKLSALYVNYKILKHYILRE